MLRDLASIYDILDSIILIQKYSLDTSPEDLVTNTLLQDAILRRFSIIGEAGNRISPEVRQRYPAVPWRDMVDMRNHVVHQYDEMNFNLVWQTIENDFPPLKIQLQKILAELSQS